MTTFPQSFRRGNPDAVIILKDMIEFLRDAFDAAQAKFIRGNAAVPSATTSVVVSIGSTITTYSVVLTPTNDPGGRFWVSGKTTTQFTINLSTAAPVGGVGFDWIVKGA